MKPFSAKASYWSILQVFESDVRVDILKLLLQIEMASLSEIAKTLENTQRRRMTLPAVLKHMKLLEEVGMVRQESGIYFEEPDARRTLYFLEGKERIARILKQLEETVIKPSIAGDTFNKTAKMARWALEVNRKHSWDKEKFEPSLSECESDEIYSHLTDDEKKKVKLWRMTLDFLKG